MKVQVTNQGKVYLTENNHILKAKEKCGMTIGDFIGDTESGTLNAPSTVIEPDFSGITDLGNYALERVFDGNKIIKNGTISFPDLTSVTGQYALYQLAYQNTNITNFSAPKLTSVTGQYALSYFLNGTRLTIFELPELTTINGSFTCQYLVGVGPNLTIFSLPKLTSIMGSSACSNMVANCASLTTINLPLLATINGDGAFASAFQSCSALTSVEFPELTSIICNLTPTMSSTFSGCGYFTTARFPKLNYLECGSSSSCFQSCFNSNARLEHIYFNGLTTTSFANANRAFYNMFNTSSMSTSGNCTIHFPSNLETTIQGLNGYPNFGATAGRLTLAYDLPATS